ncbi:MAG TPA: glycosyltransferase family 39 protein, partial [Polyangiales bacterium]|nr:glycosyltransferase family 39 protein [Polyangiales bacterium]
GFFRDELYFIVCGRQPAWGYVDQPPLVPLIAAGSQLFGISLVALRATAAFCAAAGVFVSCRLVQEWGGARFAQILTAIVVTLTPVLCAFGEKVGPDMVGLWLWPLGALYVSRLIRGANPRWWLAVGAALGIACEAKYSVIFFGIALVLGITLSPSRRVLLTPWFAAGMALGALIALPNFVWQAAHGFPMWELLRNAQIEGKNVVLSPGGFVLQELLITNFLLAPIWIIGLVAAFVNAQLRWAGWTFVLLMAMMIALHGKHYYPADVYPLVIASGALVIEQWTHAARWIRPVIAVAALLFSLWTLPMVEPILPEARVAAYETSLAHALHTTTKTENVHEPPIGQDFADMHGWPQLAALVARVYDALPPPERTQAAIVANNYGEAAAIDVFGARYHLPPALSGHNNFWLWGTHGYTGNVVIDVHGDCGSREHLFRSAR